MINRHSLSFLLILLIVCLIFVFFSGPPICLDPAGCIWIGPDDPVEIGVSGITTGLDRTLSVEIQRSIELYSNIVEVHPPDHSIMFQTHYSACLPNVPDQSAVDLSSAHRIVAVVGPVCAEDTANYTQRMVGANKVTISPIPYRVSPGAGLFTFFPDINPLVEQAVEWLQRMGISRPIVTHDIEDHSTAFSGKLCEIFNRNGTCLENQTDSIEYNPDLYDAVVQVFLDESNPPVSESDPPGQALPKIIISFSKPVVTAEQTPSFYWIGPRAWNENEDFSEAYYGVYQSYPASLASWLVYDHLPIIYRAAKESSVIGWDGSWILSMTKFKQWLVSEFSNGDIFCLEGSADCPPFAFVLYQVSGNDYKLINP